MEVGNKVRGKEEKSENNPWAFGVRIWGPSWFFFSSKENREKEIAWIQNKVYSHWHKYTHRSLFMKYYFFHQKKKHLQLWHFPWLRAGGRKSQFSACFCYSLALLALEAFFFFFFLFLGNQSSYSDLSFYPLDKCPSRLRYTLKIVTIVCN